MGPMLVGRAEELSRIAALLEHARSGVSGALVLRGEPGIGKSALLREALTPAEGMTILSVTGIEAESELPFSGLSELLFPVLDLLPEIPGPQADALAGALALGPALATPDPFAVSAATLSLMAVAAERRPVLAIVDDAHWLDAASRDALLFAVRRLHADRIAVLFGVREGEEVEFRPPGIPELAVEGISAEASRELIARSAGKLVPNPVADGVHRATHGNPLAILESLEVLSAGQLAGTEPLEEPLPMGPGVQRSFERRIARLPEETRKALLLVAASQSGSIDEIRRGCHGFGTRLGALEPAEVAGLTRNDGLRIQFGHPLMRAAVYHGATAPDRRSAHAALASVLTDPKSLVPRAWHLAAAAQGEDEDVAAILERAAVEARRRSGLAAASRAFERAARLTPDPERRAARLHEAGTDAYVGGESQRGIALLDEALALARGIALRADLQHSRARAEMWTGSPARARHILLSAVDQIEAVDAAKAALMLVDAATTAFQQGDAEGDFEGTARVALAVAERAYRVGLRAGGQPAAAAAGAYGKALAVYRRPDEAYRLLVQSLDAIDERESLQLAVQLINSAAAFLYFEEFDRMRAPLERLIAAARAASAPGALPYALGHLSELDFRTGRWAQAYADASEAVALATELDHRFSLIYALACLAWIEAGRGLEADCRAHLTRMLSVSPHAKTIVGGYSARIAGLLNLGYGRNEEAIKHLEPLSNVLRSAEVAAPFLFQEMPDLIEAYVHSGHRAEAETALATFQDQVKRSPGTWVFAAAERCRGLLEEDFEPYFIAALELHDRTTMPFERARTELCYGERLRRAKQRSEARTHLHSALEVFETIGADPWADRARNELRATGETVRRQRPAMDDLTLQELQVALKVAEGATNREAAAALFISPKTVEAHLSRIYSKLGLRSRTELAHRFATKGSPELAAVER
ncbi:MAG: AAA family ATPase [Candidatus Dormibacteraeota bacterium]|nr:AAA family ATPase [Candidatus Dormibacteraeota bacterium]